MALFELKNKAVGSFCVTLPNELRDSFESWLLEQRQRYESTVQAIDNVPKLGCSPNYQKDIPWRHFFDLVEFPPLETLASAVLLSGMKNSRSAKTSTVEAIAQRVKISASESYQQFRGPDFQFVSRVGKILESHFHRGTVLKYNVPVEKTSQESIYLTIDLVTKLLQCKSIPLELEDVLYKYVPRLTYKWPAPVWKEILFPAEVLIIVLGNLSEITEVAVRVARRFYIGRVPISEDNVFTLVNRLAREVFGLEDLRYKFPRGISLPEVRSALRQLIAQKKIARVKTTPTQTGYVHYSWLRMEKSLPWFELFPPNYKSESLQLTQKLWLYNPGFDCTESLILKQPSQEEWRRDR